MQNFLIEDSINIINSDFFNNGPMIGFIWKNDSHWSVEMVSKNVTSILGYDTSLFLDNKLVYANLIHEDDLARVKEEIATSLKQKQISFKHKPYRVKNSQNKYIWVNDTTSIVYNQEEEITHFIGYIIDCTQEIENKDIQVNLNTQIMQEKDKLRTILRNIPDLVWIKDIEGKYILCNKRFEELYGYSEDEIINKTDYDFVDKKTADFFRFNDKKAFESKMPVSNYEEITFAIDGHKEFTYTTKTKIYDSSDNLIGILGIGKNIDNIIEQEKELNRKKEELQIIFDNSIDGLAILDLDSNFLDFNDSYLEMTGFQREELLSKSCVELSVPEDLEKSEKALLEIIEKGFLKNYEKRCIVKDDHVITINLSAVLLPNKQRILISVKNVTDSKLLESQSKLISMGEMIGNIAHQWRQPLSTISTIASGIKVRNEFGIDISTEIIPDMDMIVEQTKYLSNTIDDFKNFIKDNQDKKSFKIVDIVEKTLSLLKSAFVNNEIEIISSEIDADFKIYGFENEFMQALINILNNSKDALKDNLEDNRVIIISSKFDKGKFVLQILDNGGGIKESILDRIFEPYFTTKHQSQGTGLGLSMSYKILKEHHNADLIVYNHRFRYQNRSYKGACFEILIV